MVACILVIDQTQRILELFRSFLEAEGYEVHLMKQALEAQAMEDIAALAPDLIVLDFIYHEKELSWQMLHSLKSNNATATIPIILIATQQEALGDRRQDLLAQGVSVVFKPFDVQDFLLVVKQAIASRHAG
jgi:CheY-like chemotaxis protein